MMTGVNPMAVVEFPELFLLLYPLFNQRMKNKITVSCCDIRGGNAAILRAVHDSY